MLGLEKGAPRGILRSGPARDAGHDYLSAQPELRNEPLPVLQREFGESAGGPEEAYFQESGDLPRRPDGASPQENLQPGSLGPRGLPFGDVLRHTAVSHYFRHTGSYGQTAEQFGNSEAVIKKHYAARVSTEDTKAFYSILPAKGGGK